MGTLRSGYGPYSTALVRYRATCAVCLREHGIVATAFATVKSHILSDRSGGPSVPDNFVLLCQTHNIEEHDNIAFLELLRDSACTLPQASDAQLSRITQASFQVARNRPQRIAADFWRTVQAARLLEQDLTIALCQLAVSLRTLGYTHEAWDALISASRIRVPARYVERCTAVVEIVTSSLLRQMGYVRASYVYSRSALTLAFRIDDKELLRVALLTHFETVMRLARKSAGKSRWLEVCELLAHDGQLWRGRHRGRIRPYHASRLMLLDRVPEARAEFLIAQEETVNYSKRDSAIRRANMSMCDARTRHFDQAEQSARQAADELDEVDDKVMAGASRTLLADILLERAATSRRGRAEDLALRAIDLYDRATELVASTEVDPLRHAAYCGQARACRLLKDSGGVRTAKGKAESIAFGAQVRFVPSNRGGLGWPRPAPAYYGRCKAWELTKVDCETPFNIM